MREGSKGWREGREEAQEGDSVQDSTGEGSAGEKELGISRLRRASTTETHTGELTAESSACGGVWGEGKGKWASSRRVEGRRGKRG